MKRDQYNIFKHNMSQQVTVLLICSIAPMTEVIAHLPSANGFKQLLKLFIVQSTILIHL